MFKKGTKKVGTKVYWYGGYADFKDYPHDKSPKWITIQLDGAMVQINSKGKIRAEKKATKGE
jgi:hypothetical protein